MIKALIACVMLCSAGLASASTVKLECTVAVKKEFSSGDIEKGTEEILLEIETSGGITTIQGTFGNGPEYLSTRKSGSVTEVMDSSDSGKWEIDMSRSNTDSRRDIFLRIDRNTGALYYQNNFIRLPNETGILTTVSGKCKKVDAAKRKF